MRSHWRPKTRSNVPTTVRSVFSGTTVRAGPRAATITPRASVAAATPQSAERQPRASPAASTIVSASTISTALARNVDATRKMALTRHPRRARSTILVSWLALPGANRAPRHDYDFAPASMPTRVKALGHIPMDDRAHPARLRPARSHPAGARPGRDGKRRRRRAATSSMRLDRRRSARARTQSRTSRRPSPSCPVLPTGRLPGPRAEPLGAPGFSPGTPGHSGS